MALLAGDISLCAWRMGLDSGGRDVPLPVLRGAFGAALHDLSLPAYEAVFRPNSADDAPAYLLRHGAHRLAGRSLFELVLFGPALGHLEVVLAAMQLAGERGLGRDRRPFAIERLAWLDPSARPSASKAEERAFVLDQLRWPLAGEPAGEPCRLLFPEPVRMLRKHELLTTPTLRDVVVAGCRRLTALAGENWRAELRSLTNAALDAADALASQPFVGEIGCVGRWSASQQQYVELRGVSGWLDLPEGPDPLWPLLAALQWTHVGKATVVGLGRLVVVPIW